ncbi:MAG: type II toxin-antitoxin system MqsA family antitoxin [Ramlibacter sp.]|jgi:HTH-type transcriptional regulator/antitoxin MqsA|nr:type II toxin-antitoxin system MqsA family antitoxin [Ramlibacter sp.]
MNSKELCPICGEGHVTDHVDQMESEYKGQKAMVPLHYQLCDTCHSDFAGAKQSRLNKRSVMAFRKAVDGLLTGAEICALREKYKLTQAQAAKLFGGGPVAFSKYENDDVAQSEAMDTLLRLVLRSEACFWSLLDAKGMAAEFAQERVVSAASTTAQILVLADYRGDAPRGPGQTTLRRYSQETKKWK